MVIGLRIRFLDTNHEFLTEWENYPGIPNVGDSVVLKVYPKSETDLQWIDMNEHVDIKPAAYIVKERQWHKDKVLIVVEKCKND